MPGLPQNTAHFCGLTCNHSSSSLPPAKGSDGLSLCSCLPVTSLLFTLSSTISISPCSSPSPAHLVLQHLHLIFFSNIASTLVPEGSFSPLSAHCLLPCLPLGLCLQLHLQAHPSAPTIPLLASPFLSSHLPSLCSEAQPLSFLGAENLLCGYKVLPQLAGGDKWFVDNEPNEAVFKAAQLLAHSPQLVVCKPISLQSSASLHIRSSGGDTWIYLLCELVKSSPAHITPPCRHQHQGAVTSAFHLLP